MALIIHTMMAKKKYYHKAHDLYVHQGWEAEQISSLFGISVMTVHRWRKDGGWEKERVAVETSPWQMAFKIKEEVYNSIKQKQLMGESLESAADGLVKLMSIVEKLEKKANILGHALIILRDMAEWMKTHYPIPAKEFAKIFPSLTDYLWVKYSK